MLRRRHKSQLTTSKEDQTRGRIFSLMVFVLVLFILIVTRLFQIQVFRHDVYSKAAEDQHMNEVVLPAKRGDIFVKDQYSKELSKLATNTTLDLLYIDPNVEIEIKKDKKTPKDGLSAVENKKQIALKLPPLIFPKDEYTACKKDPKDCAYDITEGSVLTKKKEASEDDVSKNKEDEDGEELDLEGENEEEEVDYEFKDYKTVLDDISSKILEDISKENIDFVVLRRDAENELMEEIKKENLEGITVDEKRFMISADPTLIPTKKLDDTAILLSKLLKEPASELKAKLTLKKVRYVAIKNKLTPEISSKIRDLGVDIPNKDGKPEKVKLKGVVLVPEHWRFYPEGQLASNVVGFIDQAKSGQYGIEGYYNVELEGKKGSIISESDPKGRQITVGDTKIVNAVDGENIVLTIDRIIQKKVEEVLEKRVKEFKADSGQVIVMDPFTGAIISMANYPTFDANDYADSLKLRKFIPSADTEPYRKMEIFKKDERGKYIPIDKLAGDLENSKIQKYVYENKLGLGALKNKTVSEYYEPGSTFKPLIMSVALDVGEVTPQTTYNNSGPVYTDEFNKAIENSTKDYTGTTTMTQVLQKSYNTGMVFVAKKLGAKVMYTYLKNFGFGEYTNIGLEGEVKADLDYYTSDSWNVVGMMTRSFGQGIVVTPLQLITAWSALANGGKLMQPYIVDSVIKDGKTTTTEPKVINRVISEETSSIITSMLVSVIKDYGTKYTGIPHYTVAGKTGTAQIVTNGKYEIAEDGFTITSFVGYAPATKPRFIILVKVDRPRIGRQTWGETTAGPIFKEIAQFMLDYYNIEPDS